MRLSALKSTNIMAMFKRSANANKRKNEGPVSSLSKRMKPPEPPASAEHNPISVANEEKSDNKYEALLKNVYESSLDVTNRYERKFAELHESFQGYLSQLSEYTTDAKAQRILEQRREIIRLKQMQAMQTDKHFVYDAHLTRVWCMLCRKWLATGLVK